MNFAAFSCISVSYTHLDVYKRQALHGSSIAAGDTITVYDEEEPTVIYDTGDEYAWINKLDAGEALAISSVFMDTPQFCLVLSDGTVLQISQSGKDGSLLLSE